MYAEYFGLREPPFNITPDPRFLYLNDCYQEALAALGYGIEARKGFISLIGDAGTGKTTLLRRLLDTVGPATKTVLLLNPMVSSATLPVRIMRSAQEILRPYFCFTGQSRRRAFSRFTLSGQLLSGAYRC